MSGVTLRTAHCVPLSKSKCLTFFISCLLFAVGFAKQKQPLFPQIDRVFGDTRLSGYGTNQLQDALGIEIEQKGSNAAGLNTGIPYRLFSLTDSALPYANDWRYIGGAYIDGNVASDTPLKERDYAPFANRIVPSGGKVVEKGAGLDIPYFVMLELSAPVVYIVNPQTHQRIDVPLYGFDGWCKCVLFVHCLLYEPNKFMLGSNFAIGIPARFLFLEIESIDWDAGKADVKLVKEVKLDKPSESEWVEPPDASPRGDIEISNPKKKDEEPVIVIPVKEKGAELPQEDDPEKKQLVHAFFRGVPVLLHSLHGPTRWYSDGGAVTQKFNSWSWWSNDIQVFVDHQKMEVAARYNVPFVTNQWHGVYSNPSGSLFVAVGYYFEKQIYRLRIDTSGDEPIITEGPDLICLATLANPNDPCDVHGALVHSFRWLDDRYGLVGTQQFAKTSFSTDEGPNADVIPPAVYLVDVENLRATPILSYQNRDDAQGLDTPTVISGIGSIVLATNNAGRVLMFVGEEDVASDPASTKTSGEKVSQEFVREGVAVFDITDLDPSSIDFSVDNQLPASTFVKRLYPGRELPEQFAAGHNLLVMETSCEGSMGTGSMLKKSGGMFSNLEGLDLKFADDIAPPAVDTETMRIEKEEVGECSVQGVPLAAPQSFYRVLVEHPFSGHLLEVDVETLRLVEVIGRHEGVQNPHGTTIDRRFYLETFEVWGGRGRVPKPVTAENGSCLISGSRVCDGKGSTEE